MKVEVRIIGTLRQYFADDRSRVDLPQGATAMDALGCLQPPPWITRGPLLVVINEHISEPATLLHEGDRVVFMLPVGGG